MLIASISAHRVNFPQPQVHYNASKTAVVSIKSSLAAEWARYGIRVNSISPGYMDTILNEGPGLEISRQIWTSRNPMGRMGQPEELIGPIVMLCSRAGSYVNGCDIVVDGKGTYCICKEVTNLSFRRRNGILEHFALLPVVLRENQPRRKHQIIVLLGNILIGK